MMKYFIKNNKKLN